MAAISIDAGTTTIKAVGYDDDGREAVVARRATAVHRARPGWAEQDMDAVHDAVADAVREAVQGLGAAGAGRVVHVDHVAITAQGDGAWLVDADGAPTGRAVLWNDGRAGEVVDAWTRDGVVEQAFALNGSLTSSGLPNAVLAWFREHDPERLQRSATVLTCGSWIFRCLTGQTAVDESDASAPFLDIRTRAYSPELLRLFGLEWAAPLLPEVRTDDRRTAPLGAAAAERLGLAAGTPVVLAPYDIASTALGVGAVRPGQACSILGTTLCTEVVTDEVRLGGPAAGLTVALGVPGLYLRAFPTLAGGEVVQWASEVLGVDEPLALGLLASGSEVGARGVVFLPYLSPAGERAPFRDPQARGSLLGLSLEHDRSDVARAVLEGLSLVVRDCLEASAAQPDELRVCGGGAASALWLQMIADVTGVPVSRSVDTEVGARGAYLSAVVATGAEQDVQSAADRSVVLRDTLAPDPGRAAAYAGLFEDFLALRRSSAASWPRLAARRGPAVRPEDAGALPPVAAPRPPRPPRSSVPAPAPAGPS